MAQALRSAWYNQSMSRKARTIDEEVLDQVLEDERTVALQECREREEIAIDATAHALPPSDH